MGDNSASPCEVGESYVSVPIHRPAERDDRGIDTTPQVVVLTSAVAATSASAVAPSGPDNFTRHVPAASTTGA